MRDTGYSSKEYREVFSSKGELLDETYPPLIQVGPTLFTIYPFSTRTITRIPWGISYKSKGLVAGLFITDPLDSNNDIEWNLANMAEIPGTTVETYKEHAIVDLQSYDRSKLPENHRRNIKKCSEKYGLFTGVSSDPILAHGGVKMFYDNLKKRHGIKEGAWSDYSYLQIEQLLKVPGAVLFQTVHEELGEHTELLNLSLFYIDKGNVYYILSCQSDRGYETNSNFIMMDTAINFFKGLGYDKLLIGSVADGSAGEGLWRFKKGFSSETRHNHIIKVVYDAQEYQKLCEGKEESGRFPAYL